MTAEQLLELMQWHFEKNKSDVSVQVKGDKPECLIFMGEKK
jgi:hypothetical protein